jgi:hypothetical protein
MSFPRSRGLSLFLAFGLGAILMCAQSIIAQDHVVTSSDIKKDLQAATAERKKQLAQVDGFLSTSQAKKALGEAHLDYQQVHGAVQSLSDEDLARVSARAYQAQKDFAAGNLSDRDLILIILAIAVLVLIIVAVR